MPPRKSAGGFTPGTDSSSNMLGIDQNDTVGEGGLEDVAGVKFGAYECVYALSYTGEGTVADPDTGIRAQGGLGNGAN